MDSDLVIDIAQRALWLSCWLLSPLLLTILAIGLIVSILQAATQINESTLSFIPKLIGAGCIAMLCGPWMLDQLTHYIIDLYQNIPQIVL